MGEPPLHLLATATFAASLAGGTGAQGPESKLAVGNATRSCAASGVSFPAALAIGASTRPTAINTATRTPRLVTRRRPNVLRVEYTAVEWSTPLPIASAPGNFACAQLP